MRKGTLLLAAAACLGAAGPAAAADWPQFRGPGGLGIAPDKGVPTTWGADKDLKWKTELPGPGTSSPVVVGDRVFLTCYSGYGVDRQDPGNMKGLRRHVLCLERKAGKVLWAHEFPADLPEPPYRDYIALHGYASSTPTSDGKRVYFFLGKSGVFAFDLGGKRLWQASVGKGTDGWGSGTSPALYKGLVIVNASVEGRALVALDKDTGNEVWRAKGLDSSWSTPALVPVPGGKTELVVSASRQILGFDPETGKELWHANSFNWYVCPSVVYHDGVVYALQNSTCVAVRAGGRGDVTESRTLWQKKFGTTVSSPLYYDGQVYFAGGDTAYCLRADDGKVVYRERLKPGGGDVYASPVEAGGNIYYVSRTAGACVVQAGPKFRLLAHNTLAPDTSVFNASPAVSDSELFLRSDRYLYCIAGGR
jgi:outer membrane protein assembly factor BamB